MARTGQPQIIHLDTHIVCWLFEGRTDLLSEAARQALEEGHLFVSPIVTLELQYLFEIKRVTKRPDVVLAGLRENLDLDTALQSFASIVRQAIGLAWTRDPFDRLIVAAAMVAHAGLITKDATIHKHCGNAIW
ncbi:MAG: PIN domain-containing protein [Nitrospirota bacterium]|nr:PIN domain-containing protein [Nitrospirota bacterium]